MSETLGVALARLAAPLREAGMPDAMRDLRILGAHVLAIPSDRVSLHLHDVLSPREGSELARLARLRAAHMPVAKLIGRKAFWGRDFAVSEDVLDPRPETETLIAAALETPARRVLDLGTGSGAIGLTLALEWAEADVVLCDISAAALEIAKRNAGDLGATARLIQSDWFENIEGTFDLIVSNPPYIAVQDYAALMSDVVNYEPRIALTDEGDGLGAYRHICRTAGAYLGAGGRLIVEIGFDQGKAVCRLFELAGFTKIQCLADMDGRDRVVRGIWPTGGERGT